MTSFSTSKFLLYAFASKFNKSPNTILQDFSGHLPNKINAILCFGNVMIIGYT